MSAPPSDNGPAPAPLARIVAVPGFPTLDLPSLPQQSNTFGNRVQSCSGLASSLGPALGLQPNSVGVFTAQCAN
jgi:hypothetical protein